jgi:trans-2,3-dihydro-3-hydroxyanthranilate isomerase
VGARRLTWLDVFSDRPLRGNQLAVVHDADGLDAPTMLAFTRETKLSEATFVQSPHAAEADYRVRIFDAGKELPFAGHPSLGTAVAVARARDEQEASYVQQTIAGLQPVEVRLAGERAEVSMLQEPADIGQDPDPAEVLPAVGLETGDGDPRLPLQFVSTGVPQLIAPVRAEALPRARPDWDRLEPLLDGHEAITIYLAVCDPEAGSARARSFGHTRDMGEDPATGSAAGPLMAYLHERAGTERLDIEQGIEMGRPSRLVCSVEGDRVRVGGGAFVLVDGTVFL